MDDELSAAGGGVDETSFDESLSRAGLVEADPQEIPNTYMQRAAVANAAAMRERDAALARGDSPYQAFLAGEEVYQEQMTDLLKEWRQREYPNGSEREVSDVYQLFQSRPCSREEDGEVILPSQSERDHYGAQVADAVEARIASPMPVPGSSEMLTLLHELEFSKPEGWMELEERFFQRILTDSHSTSSRKYFGEICMRYGHFEMGREVLVHALETEYSAQMLAVENDGNGIRGEYLPLAQEMLEKLIEVEGPGSFDKRRTELLKILELRYDAMTAAIERSWQAYRDSSLDPRVTRAHRRNIARTMIWRGFPEGFARFEAAVADDYAAAGRPMDTLAKLELLLELSREGGTSDTARWALRRAAQQLKSRGLLRSKGLPRSLIEALGIEEDQRAE